MEGGRATTDFNIMRAFETVSLRKSNLIALSLNCSSQQLNDFTLVKNELMAA